MMLLTDGIYCDSDATTMAFLVQQHVTSVCTLCHVDCSFTTQKAIGVTEFI